jgi:DNA-binding LytR/AlgR family response regulator
MQVLIIEDEAPAWRRLKSLIEQISPEMKVLEVIESVEAAVKWLKHYPNPDIIFMDIQLADGLSFEIFEQTVVKSPVIFTTAYHEYTLKAFKTNGIDYLLKPIKPEELQQSIEKFKALKNQFMEQSGLNINLESLLQSLKINQKDYKTRFLVKLGERLISIQEEEIAYFLADSKIVLLITRDNKKYAVDYTLDQLEGLLNPANFYRLNRQYIVHFQAITSISTYFNGKLKIHLKTEVKEEVLVSREKSTEFKQWLDK